MRYAFRVNCQIKALTGADQALLWEILALAAHDSLENVVSQPQLARYAAAWGRAGDLGFVASFGEVSLGAAWLRLWPDDDKGFGYINAQTPELVMAVAPLYRNLGFGTRLLSQILAAAQGVYPAVSLSVRADNPAVEFYRRAGFAKIVGSEIVNRTGGISFAMVKNSLLSHKPVKP